MFRPTQIIVHHSATADSGTVSWGAIRRFHTYERGWADIGYHGGIELVGDAYECFYGRPTTMSGAHTKGENDTALGFCFVGNYDLKDPEYRMLYIASRRVLVPWMEQYGIGLNRIFGHRSYANKTCPGERFEMERLLNAIRQVRKDAE